MMDFASSVTLRCARMQWSGIVRLPWLIWIGAATPAVAQFTQIATTSDGAQLLFVTNLRQPEKSQTLDPKLFCWSSAGIAHLFTRTTCDEQRLLGPCGISGVQTSADGSFIVYQGTTPCHGGSTCFSRELNSSTLVTPAGNETYPACGRYT
jgi:hypothetical protein